MLTLVKTRGLLVPIEWDNDGAVTGLSFCTINEEEYKIAKNNFYFNDLMKNIQQTVLISGRIEDTEKGHKILHVDDFRISYLTI